MPTILKKEDEAKWVNPDITEPEHLLPLLNPYPAELMEGWHVGDEAKSYKSEDSPALIKTSVHYQKNINSEVFL